MTNGEGQMGSKIETGQVPYFKGLDGKEYRDPQALEVANRQWFQQNNRYISGVTGKEFGNYDDMVQAERTYWEQQIIPGDKNIIQDIKKPK